jgi:hypothetical protein
MIIPYRQLQGLHHQLAPNPHLTHDEHQQDLGK